MRKFLHTHQVATVYENGWDMLKNGELISIAETNEFEILISTDQHLKYQQNLRGRKIAIVVLLSTTWPKIQHKISAIILVLEAMQKGDYMEIPV